MNLKQVILTRRTIHQFNSQPVEESLLESALELALWAPNHKLSLPWHFTKVGVSARKQLALLAAQIKAEKESSAATPTQIEMITKTYLSPAFLIALAIPQSPDAIRMREDYASVAMGVQNISLFLWSHQVGTKWASGPVTRHKTTYSILKLDSLTHEIVGFLWIGRFDHAPEAPMRNPLRQHLRQVE